MNDLPSVIKHSKICSHADDVKLYKPIISSQHIINPQSDIDNSSSWCKEWSLKLNLKKWAVLDFGPHTDNIFPCMYSLNEVQIPHSNLYKDLGIMTPSNFNFSSHHFCIVNSAHTRHNLVLRAFTFSNFSILYKLFCTYVRPTLEYCSSLWSPHTLEHIDLIENVQRSFTRRLPGISCLSYHDRLIVTNHPSLKIRRLRTDCILLYNTLHKKIYTLHSMFTFRSDVNNSNAATRKHNLKLFIPSVNSNIVKFSFFIAMP